MGIYKFYDTDINGVEEYHIEGDNFRHLLQHCLKYSATFSIRVTGDDVKLNHKLEEYRIPITENVIEAYTHYYSGISELALKEIHHYRLNHNMYDVFDDMPGSVFEWINGWGHKNPEDPAFFRADGSIFFSSIIHQGECTIFANDDEDISRIIKQGNWIKITHG